MNSLKDQLPDLAKNKLHEVKKLDQAWSILDELYGQKAEIRSKLKGQINSLTLKATKSPEKEIKLFNSIQYISSRIKVAGGKNMLEADEEYISILCKYLSPEQLRRWVRNEDQS